MDRISRVTLFCFLCFLSGLVTAGNRPATLSLSAGAGNFYFGSKRHIDNTALGFVGAGYNFTYHWGIDTLLGFFLTQSHKSVDHGKQVNGTVFAFDALYRFSPYGNFEPYVLAGPGILGLSPNGDDPNNEGNINAGIGTQYFIDKSIAFRVEARDFYTITGGKNDVMLDAGITFLIDIC